MSNEQPTREQAEKQAQRAIMESLADFVWGLKWEQLTIEGKQKCIVAADCLISTLDEQGLLRTGEEVPEQMIRELAQGVCQELTGYVDGGEDGQREFIESLIKEWLDKAGFKKVCATPHKEEWKDKQLIQKQAMIKGITLYAWWKDGEQYVGSCGRTLKQAIADIEKEFEAQVPEGVEKDGCM